MARTQTNYTLEQREFWVGVLHALNQDDTTHAKLMADLGISQATLYRRLAMAKAWAEEMEPEDEQRGSPEIDAAPVLHLTTDPDLERQDWYDLGTDRTSRDHVGGAVLVGNHSGTRLRRQRLGTGTRSSEARNDKYRPDPTLKGGCGSG